MFKREEKKPIGSGTPNIQYPDTGLNNIQVDRRLMGDGSFEKAYKTPLAQLKESIQELKGKPPEEVEIRLSLIERDFEIIKKLFAKHAELFYLAFGEKINTPDKCLSFQPVNQQAANIGPVIPSFSQSKSCAELNPQPTSVNSPLVASAPLNDVSSGVRILSSNLKKDPELRHALDCVSNPGQCMSASQRQVNCPLQSLGESDSSGSLTKGFPNRDPWNVLQVCNQNNAALIQEPKVTNKEVFSAQNHPQRSLAGFTTQKEYLQGSPQAIPIQIPSNSYPQPYHYPNSCLSSNIQAQSTLVSQAFSSGHLHPFPISPNQLPMQEKSNKMEFNNTYIQELPGYHQNSQRTHPANNTGNFNSSQGTIESNTSTARKKDAFLPQTHGQFY